MGRFFITNSAKVFASSREVNDRAGLEVSVVFDENDLFGAVYKKRINPVPDHVDLNGGRELAVSGTVVSNGQIGVLGLPEASDSDELISRRSEIMGHYALIDVCEENITVTIDPIGSYEVFYYENGAESIVSNSLFLIAQVIESSSVNEVGLLERSACVQNITKQTPIQGVCRLTGSEIAELRCSDFFIRNAPDGPGCSNPESCNPNSYASLIRQVGDDLESANVKVGLHFTGGLDSRMLLCGLLSAEVQPILLYGVGNSKITNTKDRDLQASQEIATAYGLDHYKMDWTDDYSSHTEEWWQEQLDKYGLRYRLYGSSKSVFTEYEGGIDPYPDVLMLGTAPAFTNSDPWEKYNEGEEYGLGQLVDEMMFFDSEAINNYSEFRTVLRSGIAHRLGISESETISGRDMVNFKFMLYTWPESIVLNVLNEFVPTLCPLSTSKLVEPLFSVPNGDRKNNQFQISVIESLDNRILKFPIFSGTNKMVVSDGGIRRPRSDRVISVATSLAADTLSVLPDPICDRIRKRYREKKSDQNFSDFYLDNLQEYGFGGNLNTAGMSERELSQLFLNEFGANYAVD